MIDVSGLIKTGLKSADDLQKNKIEKISKLRGWAGPIVYLLTALPFIGLLWAWLVLSVYFQQYRSMSIRAVEIVETIGPKFFFSIISVLLTGTVAAGALLAKKNIDIKNEQHKREAEVIQKITKREILTGFNAAYKRTLDHEGGYVNDKTDKGGETYKGISRKSWPEWKGWKYVDRYKHRINSIKRMNNDKKLTILVQKFYYDNFWTRCKCEEVSKLSNNISIELFDTAVNCGQKNGIKFFQRAINLCTSGLGIDKLNDDGIIGNLTIETASIVLPKYERSLLAMQNYYQAKHYIDLCKNDETQYKYIRGWMNRT